MSIIAISGYSGSGKDLVGRIIQLLHARREHTNSQLLEILQNYETNQWWIEELCGWEIKKFAGKLKEIASMLTGIPIQKFEDQEFKKTNLGKQWNAPIPGEDWQDGKPVDVPMSVRQFLQKLGTDGLRDGLHQNVWVNALFADYTPIHTDHVEGGFEYPNWILTDCRFPNEAKAVKEKGGIIIRIDRPGVTAVNAHPSETGLDDWAFDAQIINDGSVEDLFFNVKQILEEQSILV